ncbi:60S ribosomal protein L18a-like protein [Capsicum annuum]|nr:60S ribosomal protein L18a-like protein [Capsicum annuum]
MYDNDSGYMQKETEKKEAIAFISLPGYAVAEGRPIREHRLPCCGMGIGWFLFIIGCFLGAIPWYIGAFLLLCVRLDYREKPGFIACTLAVWVSSYAPVEVIEYIPYAPVEVIEYIPMVNPYSKGVEDRPVEAADYITLVRLRL